MKFLDYIRFALKNIWRQKMRTILTIFAVIIGATSVCAMLSLVFGAKDTMIQMITATGALTQINVVSSTDTSNTDIFSTGNSGDNSGTKLDDALATKLAAMNHVSSVTPLVGVYQFNRIELKGGDGKTYKMDQVQAYQPGTDTDKQLEAGRNLTATDKEGKILLSADLASQLGYSTNPAELVGKTVMLSMRSGYTGEGADVPEPPAQAQSNGPMTDAQQQQQKNQQDAYQKQIQSLETVLEAEVIGVTKAGFENSSYIALDWARGILQYRNWQQDPEDMKRYQHEQETINQNVPPGTQPRQPAPVKLILTGQSQIETNGYDSLLVKVDDANNVEPLAADIRNLKLGAITAKQTLDSILNVFKILSIVFGVIGAISLLVAAIGVINTMIMATLERTREIGVMRATGATRAAVRRLFTFEAALLGFWGGVFGVGVAIGLTKVANIVASQQTQFKGLGNANLISVPVWLGLTVIAATTVIGMLAGMGPAIRASRMNPVEALRYE